MKRIRIALIAITILALTATSVFGEPAMHQYYPYHGSQPITGAGKAEFKNRKGFISKVQKSGSSTAIIPHSGISAYYTEQAQSTSTSKANKIKGNLNTGGFVNYPSGNSLKAAASYSPSSWDCFFMDNNSSENVVMEHTNNRIYDPRNANADENGYVYFTVRTTVAGWNAQKLPLGKNYKQTSFSSTTEKNKYIKPNSVIAFSKRTYSGIPSTVICGVGNAKIRYEFFIEKKNSSGRYVKTATKYQFHGTFTEGDINMWQSVSVAASNLLGGATVTEDTRLRFKNYGDYYCYVGSEGTKRGTPQEHQETVGLSVGAPQGTLHMIYSTASDKTAWNGVKYPGGGVSYFYTISKNVSEPGVQDPIKRVSDSTKYNGKDEIKVKTNHLEKVQEQYTYTVTQHIPAGIDPRVGSQTAKFKYSLLRFEDVLPECLQMQGSPTFKVGSTDITNWFKDESNGNSLRYPMSQTGLNNAITYGSGNGADIVMTFKVKVKDGYDYQDLANDSSVTVSGNTCIIKNEAKTVIRRSTTDLKKTENQLTHKSNEVQTIVPYEEAPSRNLEIQKVNAGGESSDTFDYSVTFTGLKADREYSYTENEASKNFTSDSSGSATVNCSIANGQKIIFAGLPVGAKYKITESGKERYVPSYTVTQGGTDVSSRTDTGEMSETLSTPQEDIKAGTTPITYVFTNTYTPPSQEPNKLTISKKTIGGNKTSFSATLFIKHATQPEVTFENTDGEGISLSGSSYANGVYSQAIDISEGSPIVVNNIPEGAEVYVMEASDPDYIQNCKTTAGSKYVTKGSAVDSEGVTSDTFTAPAGEMNAKITFTNVHTEGNVSKVSKRVVGEDGKFNFTSKFTKLSPGGSYVMLREKEGANYELSIDEEGILKVSSEEGIIRNLPLTITRPDGQQKTFHTNKNGEVGDYLEWVSEGQDGQFEFQVSWLGRKAVFSRTTEPVTELVGEAYAVFDSADGSLKFFRDEAGKYTNNQVDGTKTYYTGIETMAVANSSNVPWADNRTSVQSVVFEDSIKPKSTAYWFSDMSNTNFTEITGLERLDTSNVTGMHGMFSSCKNLTTLDVSHFDTSNVTNMSGMFRGCNSLTTLDVSHFDTSKVTSMTSMFYVCRALTTLDVSHFDTSSVTRMDYMFYNCHNLTATLNVMNMPSSYISMCSLAARGSGQVTLKYIAPVTSSNIDTLVATENYGNVVNGGQGTFVSPTPNLPPLPVEYQEKYTYSFLSGTTQIQNTEVTVFTADENGNGQVSYELSNGEEVAFVDLPGEAKITTTEAGSSYIPSYKVEGNYTHYDNLVGEAYAVFDSADGSLRFFRDEEGKYTNEQVDGTKTYYTGIETRAVANSSNAPWYSNRTSVQSVVFEDPIKPKSTAYWFSEMNNTNFTEVTGLDKLDTSNVTNTSRMFEYCRNLTTLDVSHFDTSNVTNMNSMFDNCRNLTTLDVSHFDTSNVTDMSNMFYACTNLTTLDVSHFDTLNVTNMYGMFYNCYNLTTTLNVMKMPSVYGSMCNAAARDSGQVTLKYIAPVTSSNIDTLVAKKGDGNVINGGQGVFSPPHSGLVEGKAKRDLTTKAFSVGTNVQFTNTESDIADGSISVTKQTSGNLASDNDLFTFNVTLTGLTAGKDYYFPESDSESSMEIEVTNENTWELTLFDEKTGKGIPSREMQVFNPESQTTRTVETDNDGKFYLSPEESKITWAGGEINVTWELTEDTWTNYEDLEGAGIESGTVIDNLLDYDPANPGWYYRGKISISGDTTHRTGQKVTAGNTGEVSFTRTLKNGQTFILENLPKGATYRIEEAGGHGYTPIFETIVGSEYVQTQAGTAEESQSLSTGTETIPDKEPVAFLFTNSKSQKQKLKVKKLLLGDATNAEDSFNFTLSLSGLNEGESFIDSLENTLTADALGTITQSFSLKGGQEYEVEDLPGGVEFQVTETENNYKPSAQVMFAGASDPAEELAAGYQSPLTIGSYLETDATVTFTNTREDLHFLEIEKRAEGDLSDDSDEFTFSVAFTGLKPNTRHAVYSFDGFNEDRSTELASFTSNSSGAANVSLTLKHGEIVHITGLKDGCKYTVTEQANSYIPSFEAGLGKEALSKKEGNAGKGESLSTGQEELKFDTGYLFTNRADLNSPEKTVSDTDNVTWEGVGQEIDVTQNTVKNLESVWTYKIKQQVPSGITDVVISDTYPEQLTASNIKVFVDGQDKTSQWTILHEGSEIIAYNETFSGEEVVMTFDVIPNLDKQQPLSEDGTYYVYENSAQVTLNNITKFTGNTETRIPLSGGVIIRKNVKGSLGDLTKKFEFTLNLTGLRAGEKYKYMKPEYRLFTVEVQGENLLIRVLDKSGEGVEKHKLTIKTPDGSEKAYMTDSEGSLTLPAKEGIYSVENGDSMLLFSCYNEEVSGDTRNTLIADGSEIEFTADQSGNKTLEFTLHDDESIILPSLPEGATYKVKEAASDHVASYTVRATDDNAVIASASGGNSVKDMQLQTQQERVDASDGNVTITFTNTRNIATQTGAYSFLRYWWVLLIVLMGTAGLFVWKKNRVKLGD